MVATLKINKKLNQKIIKKSAPEGGRNLPNLTNLTEYIKKIWMI